MFKQMLYAFIDVSSSLENISQCTFVTSRELAQRFMCCVLCDRKTLPSHEACLLGRGKVAHGYIW